MRPPYDTTPRILNLVASISEKLGETKSAYLVKPPAELRRRNRIRTIQSSLEIEGNTLSLDQVTAILDDKRVLAPAKDILEVKNAIEVYNHIAEFKPYSIDSLCYAHNILMDGLIDSAGRLRSSNVGIAKGSEVVHVAPPNDMVRPLLNDLFKYVKTNKDLALIKSCVFHYEFEFIHPFADGNGRMGRLWQTVILRQYNPVFEFLPIETLIKKRQQEYYNALGASDTKGTSTIFIEFMLSVINDSLEELLQSQNVSLTSADRIEIFRQQMDNKQFSRADYIRHFKNISTATASRDLKRATDNGILEKSGIGNQTAYRYSE